MAKFRLFAQKEMKMTNFRLFAQREMKMENFRLFAANGNRKRKFVLLGRQTINSNRRLLFHQAHLCFRVIFLYTVKFLYIFVQ
jgi:hypothetical protein